MPIAQRRLVWQVVTQFPILPAAFQLLGTQMPAADHRLTTLEMAQFVTDGYLRFDALVPNELNHKLHKELTQLARRKSGMESTFEASLPQTGTPLSACYPDGDAIRELLELPAVSGIIRSLAGSDPVFDHDWVHYLRGNTQHEQHLHVDAVIDTIDPTFDIQLFYFPHDVEAGAGGTRFVPGSHLRHVRAEGVSRYQHIVGDQNFEGPAGTLLVFHHGLWHAGQKNHSDQDRVMYKLRLNPREPQVRLWNTNDFDEVHNDYRDHTFAHPRRDSVAEVLRRTQSWHGEDGRYEQMQHARLWRYLTGDESYDVDYYLTRLEARAELLSAGNT